jgi:hypothetical protein
MPGDESPAPRGRARRLPIGTIIILSIALIFAAAKIGKRVYEVSHSASAYIAACERPLRGDAGISMFKNEYRIEEVWLDFDKPGNPLNMNRAAYDTFVDCLRRRGIKFLIAFGDDIAVPTTLGAVAQHWRFSPGLRLVLRSDNGADVLPNMKFGPAVGAKSAILADWCGRNQAGDCVTCEPSAPGVDAVSVEIGLKANAPVVRTPLVGDRAPTAPPDAEGSNRDQEDEPSAYECRH